jgi:nucleoside-diphosphate-sugar epimerase
MLTGRRVLLTGGGGFLGSHICERLVEHNRLVVYDSGHRDALRFTSLLGHPNLRLVRGDVLDREALRAAAREAEVVLHLAGIAGVSNYYERPLHTMQVNLFGTANVLEVARELRPALFVYFSTSEVYGAQAGGVKEEDATSQGQVKVSRWTYAVSKLAAEHLCFAHHHEHGLPLVSVRPFNVYGERQVGEGAIQAFAARALRGEPLVLHNGGHQVRAWCHVDDFSDGLLACLENPRAIGEVFNLGNPQAAVSVAALAREVVRSCGSTSSIEVASYHPEGDIHVRFPDIEKARRLLGFAPRIGLAEGLARTLPWYRETA